MHFPMTYKRHLVASHFKLEKVAHVDTHTGQCLDWLRLFEMYNTSPLGCFSFTRGSRLLQILSECFCACRTEPASGITSHRVLSLEDEKISIDDILQCNLDSLQ